jgi:hypothetical protein
VYARDYDGQTLTFGVSGSLWKDALVMYDHETESLWGHVIGKAIAGRLTGAELDMYPATQTTWAAWLSAHPNTFALKKPVIDGTTYYRYNADSNRLGIHGRRMNRSALPPKDKIIGFLLEGDPYAIPLDQLSAGGTQEILTPDGHILRITTDSAGSGVELWRIQQNDGEEGSREVRDPIITIQAFWFGWYNFHPETVILRP